MPTPFVYPCKVTKTYDADTITLDVDLGFKHWMIGKPIRIEGIDTPEMRPRKKGRTEASRQREKKLAYAARDRAKELFVEADKIYVMSKSLDKYGRWLGDLTLIFGDEEKLLSQILLDEGHAVEYDGGTKGKDWGAE